MPRLPEPALVELEGEYYHVRFRDPDDFDEWVVQSVLVPERVGKARARQHARAILEKIEFRTSRRPSMAAADPDRLIVAGIAFLAGFTGAP